jgi:hypothetical protein
MFRKFSLCLEYLLLFTAAVYLSSNFSFLRLCCIELVVSFCWNGTEARALLV